MHIYRWPSPAFSAPVSLAIGNFDGVHRGHQQLLARLNADRAAGYQPLLLSFFPHPRALITGKNPGQISGLRDRARWLQHYGLEHWLLISFTHKFRQLPPQRFIDDYLKPLGVRRLHLGSDFRFGRHGQGDLALLRSQDFCEVCELPPVQWQSQRISSSAIRAALERSDLATAAALLGHPFTYTGRVVPGFQRGRQMQVPTANLAVPAALALADGVYVVKMADCWAVANLGWNPTFNGRQRKLEAHFFAAVGDLYGKIISLEIKHFLRPERRFPDAAALRAQIVQDIDLAKKYIEEL